MNFPLHCTRRCGENSLFFSFARNLNPVSPLWLVSMQRQISKALYKIYLYSCPFRSAFKKFSNSIKSEYMQQARSSLSLRRWWKPGEIFISHIYPSCEMKKVFEWNSETDLAYLGVREECPCQRLTFCQEIKSTLSLSFYTLEKKGRWDPGDEG
jgi:hypothetical protein